MPFDPCDDIAAFALANGSDWPSSIKTVIESGTFDPPPWNIVKGPVRDRGAPAGLISRGDEVLAQWGDPRRADMVFSVTKSYIGLLAAVAIDEGRILPDEPVSARVDHPAFAPPNDAVTWRQLLQQTSEWQGSLWDIPDTVDRNRQLSPTEDGARFDAVTPYGPPGSYWDYNDVRVNALCLALTIVFARSLREVLLARVLEPMGAAGFDWDWNGYPDSIVRLGGEDVPVVVGGGHWGGGLVTSILQDLALGRLIAGGGAVDGRRILSEAALGLLLTPAALMPVYGGLWWLNTDRKLFPAAPETSVFALGVGMNAIWIDPPRGLVAAVHGFDRTAFGPFIEKVMRRVD